MMNYKKKMCRWFHWFNLTHFKGQALWHCWLYHSRAATPLAHDAPLLWSGIKGKGRASTSLLRIIIQKTTHIIEASSNSVSDSAAILTMRCGWQDGACILSTAPAQETASRLLNTSVQRLTNNGDSLRELWKFTPQGLSFKGWEESRAHFPANLDNQLASCPTVYQWLCSTSPVSRKLSAGYDEFLTQW